MELPSASIVENVQFNRLVILPNALQGTFRRRANPVAMATQLDVDGSAVRFLAGLRSAHGPGPVWVRVMSERVLLLLEVGDVRRVLERSPELFASDPPPKRKGMSHFQPHALTLSRGELWEARRQFTESVLDSAEPVHRMGDEIVRVAREEMRSLLAHADGALDWTPWHEAFQRITRRVILGDAAADDTQLTELLGELMSEANGLPSERSERFQPFVERLRSYVQTQPGGLVALFADADPRPEVAAVGQLPHWLFATADTLPANVLRALALLATHPQQRAGVDRELGEDPSALDARGLAGLPYLRACLHDAMRLWPSTPLLSRETVTDIQFAGEIVPAGTQILWSNVFHHRDRDRVPYADRFAPEEWTDGDAGKNWAFNHFSHGPQGCPGVSLSVLIGATVLAEVLSRADVRLENPALDPAQPLPHMLDVFALRFAL